LQNNIDVNVNDCKTRIELLNPGGNMIALFIDLDADEGYLWWCYLFFLCFSR